VTTTRQPAKKRGTTGRERPAGRPIALVCVSPHKEPGPQATEPDKLTKVRGKWAWCPSGAASDHHWQPVASGSLNALHVQLVKASRLVDVALSMNGVPRQARRTTKKPKSRGAR